MGALEHGASSPPVPRNTKPRTFKEVREWKFDRVLKLGRGRNMVLMSDIIGVVVNSATTLKGPIVL